MALTNFPTTVPGPELGYSKEMTPRVKTVDFGDGYTQEVPDGLNNMLHTWDLSWKVLTQAEKNTIESYLTARKGCETFNWTSPESITHKVKCRSWKISHTDPGVYSLDATFNEYPL